MLKRSVFYIKIIYVCIPLSMLVAGTVLYYDLLQASLSPLTSRDADVYSSLTSVSESSIASTNIRLPTIEEKVEGCMKMANLNSEALITQAKDNARYFLDEYRKVIPEQSIAGYKSHCWKTTYSANWITSTQYLNGSIGNVTYNSSDPHSDLHYYPYKQIFSHLSEYFHQSYNSSIACLPNVYLIGYEKCGSTFLFSFIQNLISMSTGDMSTRQIAKEPQFWARFEAYKSTMIHVPKAEDLGRYMLNFIPGIDIMSKQNKTDVLLVDGTPNYVIEWPAFTKNEHNMSNYCLLPAALPTLFPNSKYIAILRNPIDMVYSNFWWSCAKDSIVIPEMDKGPDIFHRRIIAKINTFNNCMRNESIPSIASPCSLDDNYSACIKQRIHLLDQCGADVIPNEYSPELPRCGETTLYYGIFYIHIRKWLGLVGRENLLLLTLEELDQYPGKVANDTLQFLELNSTIATSEYWIMKAMETSDTNTEKSYKYKNDISFHMRNDTRATLEIFYHPFNVLLTQLLMDNK